MKSVTDVYFILDFNWDGFSHWSLTQEEAEALLATWIKQVPTRIDKFYDLMIFDGQKLGEGGFSSAELGLIETFLLNESDLEITSKGREEYLNAFSFEICMDAAAVVGQMCINANPDLEWSLNMDVSSGPRFQSIGIVSSATKEHMPIPMMICEHVEETLKQRKSFLGRFKRIRPNVLLDIVTITSFVPESSDA